MRLDEELRQEYYKLRQDGQLEESITAELEYLKVRMDMLSGALTTKKTFNPKPLSKIEAEPTEIVCKDFLPLIKGAYNVIAGAGGVGKSTIAMRSAIRYLRVNNGKNALMVMSEDDRDENETRLTTICRDEFGMSSEETAVMEKRMNFITSDNPVSMRFVEMKKGDATVNTALLSEVVEYIIENNIAFVTLDPLKKFHSVNENSNSEMDLLVRDCLMYIAGKTKCVLLALHHSSKDKDGNGSRGAVTITDTARIAYRISGFMLKDKATGKTIPDKSMDGKVHISIIKDNKRIFLKYGMMNTDNGTISLYGGVKKASYEVDYVEEDSQNIYIPTI